MPYHTKSASSHHLTIENKHRQAYKPGFGKFSDVDLKIHSDASCVHQQSVSQ